MPEDWWPESIIVVAKTDEYELGFAITKDGFEYIEASIRLNIDGLRFALWQAKHDPEIRKRTGLE